MKKIMLGLGSVLLVFSLFLSCRKTAESVIDCFGQSLLTTINHSTDNNNAKKINFTIVYSGKHSVTSVRIDYGDGQTETISGTAASHTYAAAGTYQVKAKISLKEGGATCEIDPTKAVTVN